MPYRDFYYRWEWQLQASPEALWPLLADTNRSNFDSGTPPVEYRPSAGGRLANARRRLRLFRFGVPVEWEEEPFEWVRPYRFGVVRRYFAGPLAEMRLLADLTPQPGGSTHFVYQIWARPQHALGLIAIPLQIGVLSARRYSAAVRRYDRIAAAGRSIFELPADVHFTPGGRERLRALQDRLLTEGAPADLLALLIQTIERSDDLALTRLRPYALADTWRKPRQSVLELCLLATRAGLLDFQWDLLCPLCRGAKQSRPSLAGVQAQVHCDTCNIDFTVNFDRSVELTFRPNPAVRHAEGREFCVGGPQLTPHVVAQQLLRSADHRALTLPLEIGRYRVRTLELRGGQYLSVAPEGAAEVTLHASPVGWPEAEPRLAPTTTLHLENATESEQLFILERMAWSDQAVTAAEVTALQRFRDLFSTEVLRPGEQISVGSLTVLFTDLLDSTRLYREIGDAPAFGRVMNHFDVLRDAIAAEEGALVKTMGDAIMAVFRRPVAALHAILKAQQALASPPGGMRPLKLKAGIHSGPCIAVTLNDRLDYFGSTVNIASRLAGISSGNDVILSTAVRDDPEVAGWLAGPGGRLTTEPLEAKLKGLEAERFELWRVRASIP